MMQLQYIVAGSIIIIFMYIIAFAAIFRMLNIISKISNTFDVWVKQNGSGTRRSRDSFCEDQVPIKKKEDRRIPDVPPEAIAPSIRNPPKIAGGFGSVVDDSE